MVDDPVDARFLMANERTFLAYVRTALALQVAGLGVLQFLTHSHGAIRVTLGFALVAVGSFVGLAGYLRWRGNDRAIRTGENLPAARPTVVIATIVTAVPLVATVLIIVL
jgi:putative membrane protein